MRLKALRVRNFRCYRAEIRIEFDDITAIIGRNDAGKSTLVDALNIFFDEAKLDKDDPSKNGDPHDVAIICEFDDLPETAIIDEANPTSLADEYLLNANRCLEIHKIYDGSLTTPKLKTYAFAYHPTRDRISDLLELKRTELVARAAELGVDLTSVNRTANAPIRKAIWAAAGELTLTARLIPLDKEDAKAAWEKISSYLPTFALFKSDRASTDQDPEAQDPLKYAVKEAIKSCEADLKRVSEFVAREVKKIADKTVEKLKDIDQALATELKPEFSALKWESLFKTTITGEGNIPINKRGSGVKRLILLSFFRARAEEAARNAKSDNVVYAIEEPETSQHPVNQRLLLTALSSLSASPGCQIIVTTHTPMLARSLPDTKLRYIDGTGADARTVVLAGPEQNTRFAKMLGVLPDNGVKLFIGVEGKNDIAYLKAMSRQLLSGGAPALPLEEMELNGELIFFPLGGDNLALWTSRLHHLNRPEFHLYDRDTLPSDPPKHEAQVNAVNARENCKAISTLKRETENYIHFEAINQAYANNGIQLRLNTNFGSFDDVPVEIAKIVHGANGTGRWQDLPETQQKRKELSAKHVLNSAAAALMTRAQLDEIDPNGEVISWFAEMRGLIR